MVAQLQHDCVQLASQGPSRALPKAGAGAGTEALLLDPPIPPDANDWSPDGRFILYAINGLWALPLDGNHKPFAVVQSSFAENNSRFPPDGRWIAFQSTETGRN